MRFGLLVPAATVALAFLEQQQQETEQEVLSAGEENGKREGRKTPLDPDFEAFTQEALNRWKVPGASVAVVDGDDIWAEVVGKSGTGAMMRVLSGSLKGLGTWGSNA
ncbi:hypothetical protein PC116_g29697 [Phytophthora cactorum]|nr:hypothetical protein PC116_g29697 [Phytophthora cactorum]